VADVAEADYLELRRSSRAEVSQTIAAIDNHRPLLVENALRFVQQLRERQMDRASDRSATMLMSGKDVNELAALGDDLKNFAMIDDPHI
jgi:hypothetical protein